MDKNYDSLGRLLHVGNRVSWHDPDIAVIPSENDQLFDVVDIHGEIVEIQNKYSYAEVFGDELTIVNP